MRNVTLLDHTFDEGVALTVEARNYIAFHEQSDRRDYSLQHCLEVGYQYTRVSARLIQVMTWLLAMKALLSGEIDPEQFALQQYVPSNGEEATNPIPEEMALLPAGLRCLLERTQGLYVRIQRLDKMVRVRLAAGEVPNFGMIQGARPVELSDEG